jgi:hypothetical protein
LGENQPKGGIFNGRPARVACLKGKSKVKKKENGKINKKFIKELFELQH